MSSTSFIDYIYRKLKKGRENPYLRQVVKTKVKPDDVNVFLCAEQINPATKKLIASAEKEVLFQFYIYECGSQADLDVVDALIELNTKNKGKPPIKIKFLIDRRVGPAQWLTENSPYKLKRLRRKKNKTYTIIDRNETVHTLNNLEIEVTMHAHYAFNSYHTKQIIVDRQKLMLRSGDICSDSNVYPTDKGWIQTATCIDNATLATHAANSFLSRFRHRQSPVIQFSTEFQDSSNVILFEKNPSYDLLKRLFFDSPFKIALLEGIKNAKETIKIMTSNLNDPDILRALVAALNRNVSVFIVTGKYQFQEWENKLTMGGPNLNAINFLYRSLPIEKWDHLHVNWACDSQSSDQNKRIIGDKEGEMLHGKVTVIDERLSFAGSSPLDVQSAKFSAENDVLIESEAVAKKYLAKTFNPIFKRGLPANGTRLYLIKTSLVNDIKKQIHLKDIQFNKCGHYENLTEDKENAIENIINTIQQANTFTEMQQILKNNISVTANNCLALHRRNPFFFHQTYGRTETIKKLTAIYETHFIDKMVLKEGDTIYKLRLALK